MCIGLPNGVVGHERARGGITNPCLQRLAAYTGLSSGFNEDRCTPPEPMA